MSDGVGLTTREIAFDSNAHTADAIQRAAYRFSDRLALDLRSSEVRFDCTIHIADQAEADVDSLVADFRREVLDQVLRERIRVETEDVRNAVLAFAFSNTGLSQE